MKAKVSFSLKDQLFNPEKVYYLATQLKTAYPSFQAEAFQQEVLQAFPKLELKERITHIAVCLKDYLPEDYFEAVSIIVKALPKELDPSKTDDDFGDFIIAPLSLYIASYGCEASYLESSLAALKETTKRFSAEFAIRFFINKFPNESLAFLHDCAKDNHYHVRRLASEGSRPKLPWAQKLNIHYTEPLSLLDLLYTDKTRFVTRSVANHLNDIAKLEPELVINTLKRWHSKRKDAEMQFITKHALRTLIKQSHKDALSLVGFGESAKLRIIEFKTSTETVKVGEALEFSLKLESLAQQNLLIDYIMTYPTASNKKSQKVFKLKQLNLNQEEQLSLKKKHPMRLMTTKRLYAGSYSVSLQINGEAQAEFSFDLVAP